MCMQTCAYTPHSCFKGDLEETALLLDVQTDTHTPLRLFPVPSDRFTWNWVGGVDGQCSGKSWPTSAETRGLNPGSATSGLNLQFLLLLLQFATVGPPAQGEL